MSGPTDWILRYIKLPLPLRESALTDWSMKKITNARMNVITYKVPSTRYVRDIQYVGPTSSFGIIMLTVLTFFLYPRGRPCPSSPLLPIQGHILGNTCARHVFFDLLVSCLLAASSSSGTWYCQVHHSAVDVFRISFLDMSKPTKTATADNLVDRRKV